MRLEELIAAIKASKNTCTGAIGNNCIQKIYNGEDEIWPCFTVEPSYYVRTPATSMTQGNLYTIMSTSNVTLAEPRSTGTYDRYTSYWYDKYSHMVVGYPNILVKSASRNGTNISTSLGLYYNSSTKELQGTNPGSSGTINLTSLGYLKSSSGSYYYVQTKNTLIGTGKIDATHSYNIYEKVNFSPSDTPPEPYEPFKLYQLRKVDRSCVIASYTPDASSPIVPHAQSGWDTKGMRFKEYTFDKEDKWSWVIFDSTPTIIPSGAFSELTGYTEMNLPEGIEEIKSTAFMNSTGLSQIQLPSTLTAIGDRAFNGCLSLQSIFCKANTPPTVASSRTFTGLPSTGVLAVPLDSDYDNWARTYLPSGWYVSYIPFD